jgi:predicted phosphoadenosine phosphosulfate sulfurtransferase
MTNATSATDVFLTAWGVGETWIRDKDPLAITAITKPYPDRFYQFFEWYEKQEGRTAFFVGLRSQESLNRFRSVTANPGYKGIGWSTVGKGEAFRFYPIFDWTFGDIWKYIADTGLPYNRLYDRLFMLDGLNISTMRVSNLIHEKAFKALATLQDFEPDTYDRLVRRLGGVHCAALYAKDEQVYSASARPAAFATWREYRDYLLSTTPGEEIRARYTRRFAGQPTDEATCQQQVKQILINDWENNVPVMRQKAARLREVWWNRL